VSHFGQNVFLIVIFVSDLDLSDGTRGKGVEGSIEDLKTSVSLDFLCQDDCTLASDLVPVDL